MFERMAPAFDPPQGLSFLLPTASHVRLTVYDVLGHLVTTLLDEDRGPGRHGVVWDGRDHLQRPVASGESVDGRHGADNSSLLKDVTKSEKQKGRKFSLSSFFLAV